MIVVINKWKKDLIGRFDIFQAEMKSENEELKSQLSQQAERILLLEKEISGLTSAAVPPKPTDSCTKKVNKVPSENKNKKALGLLPTSCDELRKSGHFANGVYLVMNEETKKIDAVFCQFLGAKQSTIQIYVNKNILLIYKSI